MQVSGQDSADGAGCGMGCGRPAVVRPLARAPRAAYRVRTDPAGCGSAAVHQEATMAGHVYSITEIVGTSPESTDDAVRNAIAEASKTLRNLDWFEVQSIRGHLEDGYVADWQVTLKIGFRHES